MDIVSGSAQTVFQCAWYSNPHPGPCWSLLAHISTHYLALWSEGNHHENP